MDSLDLVPFMHELQELLKHREARASLASEVDLQLVQQTTVAEVFRLAAFRAGARRRDALPARVASTCARTLSLALNGR
jgi:hypothetical protein